MRSIHISQLRFTYLILIIIAIGVFLRYFKLYEFATFGHDNSRDLIKTYKLIRYNEIIYRGPVFSVIWGFMSPLYYYLILPFHVVFNFHSTTPAITSLFANTIALIAIMYTSFRIYGKNTTIIAGLLYASSVSVIKQASVGLNPSLVPPFAIFLYLGLHNTLYKQKKQLTLITITLAMILALHPSGFFMIPALIIVFALYKPTFNWKQVTQSILLFCMLGIFPYLIQEKKFAWWTFKRAYEYFTENSVVGLSAWEYLFNFVTAVTKNVSNLMFYDGVTFLEKLPIIIFAFLSMNIYNAMKDRTKPIDLLGMIILIYLTTFGLLIKFSNNDPYAGWFHTIFIPLVVIYIAYYLGQLLQTKFRVIAIAIIVIFLTSNTVNYIHYRYKADSLIYQQEIATFLASNSMGQDFDIYGVDPEPLYYLMWEHEKDPQLKTKYRNWLKWKKRKDSDLIYFIQRKYDINVPDQSLTERDKRFKIIYKTSLGKSIYKSISPHQ